MTFRPENQRKARGGKNISKARDWLKAHVGFDGPECLTWPFGYDADGYGCLVYEGKAQRAARIMCKLVNGPPPEGKPMAAHDCGNGHRGCVHPKHVMWKSWKENAADRIRDGRQATGKRGHLTYNDAVAIRELAGKLSQREIALKFNTTRSNVEHIIRGKTFNNPFKGVKKVWNRYQARIKLDGKTVSLGSFDTPELAAAAYQAALADFIASKRTA